MEKELKRVKRYNRAATVLIIAMMIIMAAMLYRTQQWVNQYKVLEERYEQLYTDLTAGGENAR